MIAACPQCKTRYRVDGARMGEDGMRLRCTQCQAVFRVRPPAAAPQAQTPTPSPAAAQEPVRDRRRLVLVADPDAESAKATCDALRDWGLETVSAHDGVEALLTLQRTLPRAVVLDAALPRMFGFQICELVKRNESLRSTWVVLVGAIHDQQRYRRPPGDLYGADAYVERPELPHALLAILRGFGLPLRASVPGAQASAAAPAARVLPAPPPPTAAQPSPGPARGVGPASPARSAVSPPPPTSPAGADGASDEQRAQAERLARIIVSDIVLYNEAKFAAAVAGNDVLRAMAAELDEGRTLLAQRVEESVRSGRDYVADELLRVARSRGAS